MRSILSGSLCVCVCVRARAWLGSFARSLARVCVFISFERMNWILRRVLRDRCRTHRTYLCDECVIENKRLAYCLLINPLHSIRENCAELFIQQNSNQFGIFRKFSKFFTMRKTNGWNGWIVVGCSVGWLVNTVIRHRAEKWPMPTLLPT